MQICRSGKHVAVRCGGLARQLNPGGTCCMAPTIDVRFPENLRAGKRVQLSRAHTHHTHEDMRCEETSRHAAKVRGSGCCVEVEATGRREKQPAANALPAYLHESTHNCHCECPFERPLCWCCLIQPSPPADDAGHETSRADLA